MKTFSYEEAVNCVASPSDGPADSQGAAGAPVAEKSAEARATEPAQRYLTDTEVGLDGETDGSAEAPAPVLASASEAEKEALERFTTASIAILVQIQDLMARVPEERRPCTAEEQRRFDDLKLEFDMASVILERHLASLH